MNAPETVIFSDVSEKKANLGAAAVILDRYNKVKKLWQTSIGPKMYWSIHAPELITVYYAIKVAIEEHKENNWGSRQQHSTFTITSDSKSALQAIANPSNKLC
jgi:hypothetical protein